MSFSIWEGKGEKVRVLHGTPIPLPLPISSPHLGESNKCIFTRDHTEN
jgi:hypothetical protein